MITVDSLNRVLSYLPVFERQPSELYQVHIEVATLDPHIYAREVDQFIETLYQEGFVTQAHVTELRLYDRPSLE